MDSARTAAILWVAAAFLFGLALLVPAAAETRPGPRVSLQGVLAIVQTQPPAVARAYAARADLVPVERRLVDALLMSREGDLAGAERELRALLSEDPSRRLVRFELARVLMARERYTAARFQIDRLIASEPDPKVRRTFAVLNAEISRRRPWDFSLTLDAAPRTNANRGSAAETFEAGDRTFDIDDVSRARSGIGFGYSVGASRRFDIGAGERGPVADAIYLRGFASGIHYEDSALSSMRVGLGAFWRHRYGLEAGRPQRTRGGFDPFGPGASTDIGVDVARDIVSGTLFDGDVHADLVTPYVAATLPLPGKLSFNGRASASRVFYEDALLDDGWRGRLDARLTYAPQAGLALSAFATQSFERSGRDFNRYDGTSVGLTGYAELAFATSLNLTGSVGWRDYRAVFPGTVDVREDRFWKLSATLTKRDWAIAGFAPRLTVSHEDQRSNVAFFTFTDTGARVSLSRSF